MSDATHGHPLERLSSYLDDELPVEERAAIDRHLALCPACREHLEALRRLSRAVAEEAVPAHADDLEARVLRRIDAAAVVPMRRRFVVPASIAATIAAVGLVAVVTWKRGGTELTPRPERAAEPSAASAREKIAKESHTTAPSAPALEPPAGVPGGAVVKRKRDDRVADKLSTEVAATGQDADAARRNAENKTDAGFAVSKDEKSADAIGGASGALPVPAAASATRVEVDAPRGPCADPVDDAGVEAVWEVADLAPAVRDLETLARSHGGRLDRPDAAPDAAFAVVLPRSRYVAFAAAARGLGISGLDGAPVGAGAGCVRQRIVLRTVAAR